MRLVLDAMGTDERPVPDVEGAVMAARELGETIILVGPQARLEQELKKHNTTNLKIEIVNATETIEMTDKPSAVLKQKPESSMHVGMRLVRDQKADAFVTMGNTGATQAIATLGVLRRLPGVKRPAMTIIYSVSRKPTVFIDVGANADSRVDWVEQFAIMGMAYAQTALNMPNPRIATLSNGEEEGKGNELVREVQARLHALPINYIGHIEPKEILGGKTDVVVFDGFLGNVFLKTYEGTLSYFAGMLREELMSGWISKLGGLLIRSAVQRIRKRVDPDEYGGALLLGVRGVVVIGHGSGNALAVKSSLKQAYNAVKGKTIETIQARLAEFAPQSGAEE
jgi:glycerol-3-phosphate acyltransferase PlsX